MKKAIIIGTIVISIIILLGVLIWIFGGSVCETKIFSQKKSPNSGSVAIHKVADCGATTGHTTSILLDKNNLLSSKGNVLTLNGYYGEEEISLMWENQNILRIDYFGKALDIRKVVFDINNINIKIYLNEDELTIEKLQELEKQIADDQASYGIFLPQGKTWIKIGK